jgi:hypothetical protein
VSADVPDKDLDKIGDKIKKRGRDKIWQAAQDMDNRGQDLGLNVCVVPASLSRSYFRTREKGFGNETGSDQTGIGKDSGS